MEPEKPEIIGHTGNYERHGKRGMPHSHVTSMNFSGHPVAPSYTHSHSPHSHSHDVADRLDQVYSRPATTAKKVPLLPEAVLGGPVTPYGKAGALRPATEAEKQNLATNLHRKGWHDKVHAVHFTPGAAEDARIQFKEPVHMKDTPWSRPTQTGRAWVNRAGQWVVTSGSEAPEGVVRSTKGHTKHAWNKDDPTAHHGDEDTWMPEKRKAAEDNFARHFRQIAEEEWDPRHPQDSSEEEANQRIKDRDSSKELLGKLKGLQNRWKDTGEQDR